MVIVRGIAAFFGADSEQAGQEEDQPAQQEHRKKEKGKDGKPAVDKESRKPVLSGLCLPLPKFQEEIEHGSKNWDRENEQDQEREPTSTEFLSVVAHRIGLTQCGNAELSVRL